MAVKLKSWVKDRIFELRQNTKLSREEIVKIVKEEGLKKGEKVNLATRSVSKYGGVKDKGLNAKQYAKRYPDLAERLLSKDKDVVKTAMGTAKRRKYKTTRAGVKAIKRANTAYRAGPAGKAYQSSYYHEKIKPDPTATNVKNSLYRAAKRGATPMWALRPAHMAETFGIYQAKDVMNKAFGRQVFDVDHRTRLADRGSHSPRNLQLMRHPLHKIKTALEQESTAKALSPAEKSAKLLLARDVGERVTGPARGLLAENVISGKPESMWDAPKRGGGGSPAKFSLMNLLKGVKGGLLGTAISLPLLMSNSPRAQAAGEIISLAVDPVGYSLFALGNQLWKRRRKVDPSMAPWQRRLVDPTHGGGLRRY